MHVVTRQKAKCAPSRKSEAANSSESKVLTWSRGHALTLAAPFARLSLQNLHFPSSCFFVLLRVASCCFVLLRVAPLFLCGFLLRSAFVRSFLDPRNREGREGRAQDERHQPRARFWTACVLCAPELSVLTHLCLHLQHHLPSSVLPLQA